MIPTQDFMILEKCSKLSDTILVPDGVSKVDETTVFIIKAMGNGSYQNGVLIPNECKVGDEVLVASYAPFQVPGHKEEVYMARDRDVILILKRGEVE